MLRFMTGCGCLLMIFSMVVLFGVTVIPVIPAFEDNQTIDDLLQPLMCQSGETIQRDQYSRSDTRGTSYSMEVYCVKNNELKRDVTNRWIMVGVVGFVAPFLIGLFSFLVGVIRGAAKLTGQVVSPLITSPGVMVTTVGKGGASMPLADRLKQVEDAHRAGLISLDEYERMRQEIMNDFS
ncbi:MAG: hypothetical protein KJ064_15165 [Anaerolineae bacterium]|nr:hypothetical protein [Anaerolineae bacterium]